MNTSKLMQFAFSRNDFGDLIIRRLQAFIRANFYHLAAALLMIFVLTITLIITAPHKQTIPCVVRIYRLNDYSVCDSLTVLCMALTHHIQGVK